MAQFTLNTVPNSGEYPTTVNLSLCLHNGCNNRETSHANTLVQLENGDILCFRPGSEDQLQFPDLSSYLEYVKNRKVVRFRALKKPEEDKFSLELSMDHSYDDVVKRVAKRLGLDDPSKIRLTSHNCYSQQPKPKPFPIKYRSVDNLSKMLVHYKPAIMYAYGQKPRDSQDYKISDILYYEVFNIPLPQLESRVILGVAFIHATTDKAVDLTLTSTKQSSVGDLLKLIKTKVELSHPKAELRLLRVCNHEIYKIFSSYETVESIKSFLNLQAEETSLSLPSQNILDEEKCTDPNDRLIHVCHFTKKKARNRVEIKHFGKPFVLVIHEGDTLADVKPRIQKKLQVSDEDFSKWKFAILASEERHQYLKASHVVSRRFELFERMDMDGVLEGQQLGLEHSEVTETPPEGSLYKVFRDKIVRFFKPTGDVSSSK